MRGPINQDEYKSYVTPILFFKRISDVYDEEYADALAFSGGDVEYAEAEEMHSFVIPDGCHWEDVRKVTKDVGKAIVKAMTGIEKANPDTLSGVFSSFDDATWTDKNKLSDERLKNLIEHMSSIQVGNKDYSADIMGDSYEFLIKKFADLSKKNAGEFYTPRTIVKLMVNLLDPQPGETVYDPACGTGGMLIEAIHHMHNDRLAYGRIYGQENNLSTSAIARMNLYLHGAKDVQIKQGDTLRNPLFLERGRIKTFDCVLANPPFGMAKWGSLSLSRINTDEICGAAPPTPMQTLPGFSTWSNPWTRKTGAVPLCCRRACSSTLAKRGKCGSSWCFRIGWRRHHPGQRGVLQHRCVGLHPLPEQQEEPSHQGRICLIDGSEIYTPKAGAERALAG